MARKIFGPQYPVSIEREYLKFLNVYANYYIRLVKEGIKDIMPDMRDTAAEEQPRLDQSFDDKITKLLKIVGRNMSVKFPDSVLTRVATAMVSKSSKHSKKETKKMIASADTKDGVSVDIEPLLNDKGMNPYFQNVVEMNVSLIKSIPAYSQPKMKEALIGLLTKDATAAEIQKVLQKNFNLTKGRAQGIARDQVGKLNGALDRHRQEQLGLKRYRWRTSEDSRVRDDHAKLDRKIFYWDKPPVINKSTGERGNPKEDFNCRCWAEPILDDIIET